ncbi:unnamed protein product [Symbiodinium sp. CCMP2592]|nr:unnamed protein product [Symbiodinium sp. CCMP2592]
MPAGPRGQLVWKLFFPAKVCQALSGLRWFGVNGPLNLNAHRPLDFDVVVVNQLALHGSLDRFADITSKKLRSEASSHGLNPVHSEKERDSGTESSNANLLFSSAWARSGPPKLWRLTVATRST